MSDTIIHTEPATGLPVGTAAVFLTLGAALVALYRTGEGTTTRYGIPIDFRWACLGCGQHTEHSDQRDAMRDKANDHASTCRAIPFPQAHHC